MMSTARMLMFAVFLLATFLFLEAPVRSYLDQRSERTTLQQERDELKVEVDKLVADVESYSEYEGLRREARCHGPYVEPGEEVYSVPGLGGCAAEPAGS